MGRNISGDRSTSSRPLDVIVTAHEARSHLVDPLLAQLRAGRVVWANGRNIWETAREALEPGPSHRLVIQEDAIVSPDLVAAVSEIIDVHPTKPVSLYMGRAAPRNASMEAEAWVEAAEESGSTLIEGKGPNWGVACVYPPDHLPELVAFGDRYQNAGQSYDGRMNAYYLSRNIKWLFTFPSLVDHDDQTRSLHSSTKGRVAIRYTGESAVGADWTRVQSTEPAALHPPVRFRHRDTGRILRVGKRTRGYYRLMRQGTWSLVDE